MTTCPTTTAYTYADSPEHEGAGFFLVLTLRCGTTFRGSCYPPANGLIWMSIDNDSNQRVCIRLADVSAAQVEW